MLHGVPWFLLGSLWAVLFCEYRAFRRRLKLAVQIRVLESELSASEYYFASEKHHQHRIRAELLDLLAAAKSSREHRPREVGDFASGRATIDKEHRPREVGDVASGRATIDKEHRPHEVAAE
jgi:hypothetical protein